jgi:pentatricopeptide repeat protein
LQWWDGRPEKVNLRYPDFKHKTTGDGLWLDDNRNPPWVAAKLATMVPGTVQLDRILLEHKACKVCQGCVQHEKAMELFQQMQLQEGGANPNSCTFVLVLNSCASSRSLEDGKRAHEQIIASGCEVNVFVGSSLVDMYAKYGSMEDAWRAFNKMPSRNVDTWNAMIFRYVRCGQGRKALELFRQMQQDEEGVQPDPVTFVGMLNACASVLALEEGRCVHVQIIQNSCDLDVLVGSSLVDMYAKCGSMDEVWRVFDKMPS